MLSRRFFTIITPTTTPSTTTTRSLWISQRFSSINSARNVYSRQPQGLKRHDKKGASSNIDNPRWKTKHDGIDYEQWKPRSGKANPHNFANAKVKHWHMWLMVLGCAIGGYYAGQLVEIDPKKLNPKDNNTGGRKIGKLDLTAAEAAAAAGTIGGEEGK